MKKFAVLLLTLAMLCSLAACSGQDDAAASAATETETTADQTAEDGSRTVATEFVFDLADAETKVVENTIFNETVTINGSNADITFVNCVFNGDVVNTADVGTRVIVSGCDVAGKCVFSNKTKEATLETSLPKFLIDAPADVVCEDCVGTTIALGDFDITLNGEEYTLAGSELYFDSNDLDAGFVPYEGQEANLHYVAQWWENGEKVILAACEFDPTM